MTGKRYILIEPRSTFSVQTIIFKKTTILPKPSDHGLYVWMTGILNMIQWIWFFSSFVYLFTASCIRLLLLVRVLVRVYVGGGGL